MKMNGKRKKLYGGGSARATTHPNILNVFRLFFIGKYQFFPPSGVPLLSPENLGPI